MPYILSSRILYFKMNSFQGISNFNSSVGDYVSEYSDKVNNLMESANLDQGIANTVLSTTQLVNGIIQSVYGSQAGKKIMDSIGEVVKGNKSIASLKSDMVDYVTNPDVIKAGLRKIGVPVDQLEASAKTVADLAKTKAGTLIDAVDGATGGMLSDALDEAGISPSDFVDSAGSTLSDLGSSTLASAKSALSDALDPLATQADAGIATARSLASDAMDQGTNVLERGQSALTRLADDVSGAVGRGQSALTGLTGGVSEASESIPSDVISSISSRSTGIMNSYLAQQGEVSYTDKASSLLSRVSSLAGESAEAGSLGETATGGLRTLYSFKASSAPTLSSAKSSAQSAIEDMDPEDVTSSLGSFASNFAESGAEVGAMMGISFGLDQIRNPMARSATSMAFNTGLGGHQVLNAVRGFSASNAPEEAGSEMTTLKAPVKTPVTESVTDPEAPEESTMGTDTELSSMKAPTEDPALSESTAGDELDPVVNETTELTEDDISGFISRGLASVAETSGEVLGEESASLSIPVVGEAIMGLTAIGVGLWSGIKSILDIQHKVNTSSLTNPSLEII